MSWTARYRTPRGTQPDTDPRYGAEEHDDAWYEPHHRAPAWRGGSQASAPAGHPGRARAQEQLSEVADALERLMDPAAAGHDAAPNRQSRRAAAARARSAQRPAAARDAGPPSVDDARTSRIEAVLGALDRLDRRVEDLSHSAQAPDLEDDEPRPARRTRQAPRPASEPLYRAAERAGHGQPAAPRSRTPSYYEDGPVHSAYDGYDDYDDQDADPRAIAAAAAAAPRRAPGIHASGLGEELRPLFNDLARRIDEANDPRDEALATMRRDIQDLRSVLVETLRSERHRPSARDSGEIRRLSEAVERMRTDRSDVRLSREMRAEIADLRALIGQSNVDGMLKSLESGYAHLVQRP
jgi:localization factor PodJL